jgi:hypothetical protein
MAWARADCPASRRAPWRRQVPPSAMNRSSSGRHIDPTGPATKTSKSRLSRDFWSSSIFDFCNSICQHQTCRCPPQKKKSRLTAASQFNPMISDHAAINAEIARGRIALTLIHPANDRCSATSKPVNVALAKAWKCMSNPTSAAEAESFLASGSFVELTSHFVQIGVRVHRQVGALRNVGS